MDFDEVTIELNVFNRMFKTRHNEFNINIKIIFFLSGDKQIEFIN